MFVLLLIDKQISKRKQNGILFHSVQLEIYNDASFEKYDV